MLIQAPWILTHALTCWWIMYAYHSLTLPAPRLDWRRKWFSKNLSLHVKHYQKSYSGFREDRSFAGVQGFELIKNRLENFPLFINEVARVPDRSLSLFRSHIGIRNRSAHSYYTTRKSDFFIIKNQQVNFRKPLKNPSEASRLRPTRHEFFVNDARPSRNPKTTGSA